MAHDIVHLSPAELVAQLTPKERAAWFDSLTEEEQDALEWHWRFWARPKQVPPDGNWLLWVIRAGRGFGKALALDTPLPTPTGWCSMGDVRVGHELLDEKGNPCAVTFATEVQLGRPCYRVVFDDGATITADADHRWLTWDQRARKAHGRALVPRSGPEVRTTEEIRRTLMASERERNHSIEVAGALQLPERELLVPPWVLGLWLGDGSTDGAAITIGDQDVDELRAYLKQEGTQITTARKRKPGVACNTYGVGVRAPVRDHDGRMLPNGSLHSRLRKLGVLGAKHVPTTYLRASAAQRLDLLRGLMDADGSASEGGHVELMLTDERLAADAHELVVSLGFKPVMAESDATLHGRVVGRRWRITWTPRVSVFRLARKSAMTRVGAAQENRTRHRYIVEVAEVPTVPVRCITVDSPSHLFLAGRSMIPTHNTRSGGGWFHERMMQVPGRWGALVAKNPADARDYMIEGPGGILRNTPPGERPSYQPSVRRMSWPNGSWATIYSSIEPDQLRGFSGDTAWMDEFAKYANPREMWDNLEFGMREASVDQPRRCITTTPRPLPFLEELEADPDTVTVVGSSYENRANLSPVWFNKTLAKYEGTRLGDQEIHASYLEAEGRVYHGFSRKLWPDGNVHPGVKDLGGMLLVGMDFNVDPMSAVLASRAGDECHIWGEIELPGSSTETMAREIRSRFPNRYIRVYPDPSGNARKTSAPVGQTDFSILRDFNMEVVAPDAAPLVRDRENNANAMYCQGGRQIMGNAGLIDMPVRRRTLVSPDCKSLIRALGNLMFKEGTSQRDKASGFDHICDAADYLLWGEFPIVGTGAGMSMGALHI